MIRVYDVIFEGQRLSVEADAVPFEGAEPGDPLRVRIYSLRRHGEREPQVHPGDWTFQRRLNLYQAVRHAEKCRLEGSAHPEHSRSGGT